MQDLLHSVIAELLPVLTAILTALAIYGLSLLAKRFKIQLADEHQAILRLAVRKAISGAEEWAARKAGVESDPIEGSKKAQWVHERLKDMYPDLAPDELDKMIDEELGAIKGAGASGEKALDV